MRDQLWQDETVQMLKQGYREEIDRFKASLATKDAEIVALRDWKQAIDDACTVDWIEATTPKETIQKLISVNIQQALDPAISEQPAKWVARIAELEAMVDAIKLETQSVCPVPYGGAIYRIIEIIGEAQ